MSENIKKLCSKETLHSVSDSVSNFDKQFACQLSLRPPVNFIPFSLTVWNDYSQSRIGRSANV